MRTIHDDDPGSPSPGRTDDDARGGGGRQEAPARSRDELEIVLDTGGVAWCRLDAAAGLVRVSAPFKAAFGWPADAELGWEDLQRHVHPDDKSALDAAVRAAREERSHFDVVIRTQGPDGGPQWLDLRGRTLDDGLVIVARNVTESRQQAEAARRERELREQAEAANRAKDEFLSVVSHELRSPLNAILGWNRILAVKRGNDPEVANITTRIERSARAQLKMVNDLLDLGRLGTGKLRIEPRLVRLTQVIALALDVARPAAAAKEIEIVTDFDATQGEIQGDPDRLQQVVSNLLSNAVKFTPSGGRIGIYLRRLGDSMELSVADTGQGIAPELLPYVFDRFRQGDSSITRQAGGLGLGLTLVREIVALHGGTVTVRSEGVGRGATFIVSLPAASRAESTGGDGSADPALPPRAVQQSLSGLSILVVDDEHDARTVVAETLRLEGAQVTISDSARSAFAELSAEGAAFDVLITDIGMPDEDGYSLLRRVRGLPAGRHLPVIALTGFASRSDAQAALAAGFDVHVPKPVDFELFVPIIRRVAAAGASRVPEGLARPLAPRGTLSYVR